MKRHQIECLLTFIMRCRDREIWAEPARSARGPAASKFVAFLAQIAPTVPILPTHLTRKHCTVYNLRFELPMAWKRSSVRSRCYRLPLIERSICELVPRNAVGSRNANGRISRGQTSERIIAVWGKRPEWKLANPNRNDQGRYRQQP